MSDLDLNALEYRIRDYDAGDTERLTASDLRELIRMARERDELLGEYKENTNLQWAVKRTDEALTDAQAERDAETARADQNLRLYKQATRERDEAIDARDTANALLENDRAMHRAALTAAQARIEELTRERDELAAEVEALDAKVKALAPHGSCGCSYDKPGDLCLHHSPQLTAAEALEAGLRPFADFASHFEGDLDAVAVAENCTGDEQLLLGDIRRAAALLKETPK